jgi:hypothetical protein
LNFFIPTSPTLMNEQKPSQQLLNNRAQIMNLKVVSGEN